MRLSVVSGAVTLVVLGGTAARAGDVVDRITRLVPMGSATRISLDVTIGEVNISGSSRRDLQIEIVRHAPSAADLAAFPAVVDASDDRVRVSAVQADDGRDPNLRADVTIAAPADAVFQGVRVFEGRVRLTNLKAACDVELRRGPVEATRLAGRIRLESGIGSIDVRDSELTPGGMMRLRVFNGPLRVRFARPPVNARILAVTFNGAIRSDITLTKADRFGPRFGETTLGSGDPVMSLDVVKGDIAITVSRR